MEQVTASKILEQGGASFDGDLRELKFKDGYVVSIDGDLRELKFKDGYVVSIDGVKIKVKDFTDSKLKEIIREFKGWSGFFGAWVYQGYVYIDKNILVRDLKEAIEIAKKHNQKAIWDVKNNKEIFV